MDIAAIIVVIILFVAGTSLLVGAIMFLCGKVSALYDYHLNNLKDSDKPKFTRTMGIISIFPSLILFGSGIYLIIVNNQTALIISIATSLGVSLIYAVITLLVIKKYNGNLHID